MQAWPREEQDYKPRFSAAPCDAGNAFTKARHQAAVAMPGFSVKGAEKTAALPFLQLLVSPGSATVLLGALEFYEI